MADNYKGECFCGAVAFEAKGAPAVAGYCHCKDCQAWSAGPINAFSLWPPESVTILRGADNVGVYSKTDNSYRKFCKICGGHLMTDHPVWKLVDVYANLLKGFDHAPTVHVNYESRMVPIRDGLPKFKDLPSEFGGSGQTLPE